MRAGQLTNTITIERSTETVNEDVAKVTAWVPLLKTRAQVVSNDAKTFLAGPGEGTATAIVFRVRYHPAIETGDRVVLGDDEFDITEIKAVVPRRVLELRCAGGKS